MFGNKSFDCLSVVVYVIKAFEFDFFILFSEFSDERSVVFGKLFARKINDKFVQDGDHIVRATSFHIHGPIANRVFAEWIKAKFFLYFVCCAVVKVDCVAANVTSINATAAAANNSGSCSLFTHLTKYKLIVTSNYQTGGMKHAVNMLGVIMIYAVETVGERGGSHLCLYGFRCFPESSEGKGITIKKVWILTRALFPVLCYLGGCFW